MNIKAIIGSGVVIVGIGMGAVYLLSQPSSKGSLYQEDEFVSVTSMEEVKPEITMETPDQAQSVEVVELDTADQSNEAVEPVIVTDASQVEIKPPSEVIEPVILERDPAEATERGLTVKMYPSWRNDLFTLSWYNGINNSDDFKKYFTHSDVSLGSYISRRAILLEKDILKTGIKPPPGGKHIATGFIDFKEDGYYYIYPVDDLVKPWIFAPYPSSMGVVTNQNSRVAIKIGSETVFDATYEKDVKRHLNKFYFKKGRYPIEVTFTKVFIDGFYRNSAGRIFTGIDIMMYKTEDAHDRYLKFVFENKRRAMLSTFPLTNDALDEAIISSPVNFKYIDWENDVIEKESADAYINIFPNDKPRVFGFTFIPTAEGDYAIGQNIYGDKKNRNAPPNDVAEQHTCRIWLHQLNNESSNEYNKREPISGDIDDVTVLSTFQSEGSAIIINVKKSMLNIPMDIKMAYWCKFSNRENYTLAPLLKTPGNNSFLPLEAFAE